jgi:hypothetical protein
MASSLLSDYQAVLSDIRSFRTFQRRVTLHVMIRYSLNPLTSLRVLRGYATALKEIDFLTGATSATTIRLLTTFSTSAHRASRWWPILIAILSAEALAGHLRDQYPEVDFAPLNKLHQARGRVLSRINPKAPFAVVLGAAAVVVKSTPRSVVEGSWGLTYTSFEEAVFWLMVFFLAYLLLILAPAWIKLAEARNVHDYTAYILEYLELTAARNAS